MQDGKLDIVARWEGLRGEVQMSQENFEIGRDSLASFVEMTEGKASDEVLLAYFFTIIALIGTTQRIDAMDDRMHKLEAKVEILGKLAALDKGWTPEWRPGDPVGKAA